MKNYVTPTPSVPAPLKAFSLLTVKRGSFHIFNFAKQLPARPILLNLRKGTSRECFTGAME
jgi:hypothetical protein